MFDAMYKWYKQGGGDFEMMIDENEFELLVPKDTKFKVIDREKLIIEI